MNWWNGLIAAARGAFTSWSSISLNRIANRHERAMSQLSVLFQFPIIFLWMRKYIVNVLRIMLTRNGFESLSITLWSVQHTVEILCPKRGFRWLKNDDGYWRKRTFCKLSILFHRRCVFIYFSWSVIFLFFSISFGFSKTKIRARYNVTASECDQNCVDCLKESNVVSGCSEVFQYIAPRRTRAEIICWRVDLLALGVIHACEWDDWRPPKLWLCLDCFCAEARVKGFKAFQSSRICFKYSEKQIGFSHRNLYNLHLLSNSSPAKTWLSTRNRIFSSTSIPLWW